MALKGLSGMHKRGAIIVAGAAFVSGLIAPASAASDPPAFVQGRVLVRHFGEENDLLRAGLTWTEIGTNVPPETSNPPTPDQLRRLAIWASYRGLISTSANEGFGSKYGTLGPVPGTEYMAFTQGPEGEAGATILVQIPDSLETERPCVVTAPSSGSRGIYGAISNAEVAFKNGCAVAYTDKGTGVGFHDLTRDVAYDIFGRARLSDNLPVAHFRAEDTPAMARFKAQYPHRIAIKHAHSGVNPEKDWGKFVLQSIRFALWAMNDHRGKNWRPSDVLVVAAGVSNGGGAALLAAEQDRDRLIDGVVVSEPQVQPRFSSDFVIRDRDRIYRRHSRTLYDVTTFMDVYADCAGGGTTTPFSPGPPGVARCPALAEEGLLESTTVEEQIAEARGLVHSYGLLPDADKLMRSHANLHLWRILAPVYGNAYARAAVEDHLCRTSFAATDGSGRPVAWDAESLRTAFGNFNGLPGLPADLTQRPRGNVDIIDDTQNPPENELRSPDINLDGALCWRALSTGREQPTEQLPSAAQQTALRTGVAEVRATGNLRGKPAIVLHGRKDALIAPNHSSRAYFGLNKTVEGARSRARYIEVTNGNHFDAFIALYATFDPTYASSGEKLVAMHGYFNDAVEMMLHHLGDGSALPGSQAFAATEENCALPLEPAAADRIRFADGALIIPAGGTPAGCSP